VFLLQYNNPAFEPPTAGPSIYITFLT
jgi:hypothetical protein